MLVPLVARAGVLAEVDSALIAARAGRGTLLTVAGEPGIGKTRLAEEAAERANGFAIVWTWGPAAAGDAALGPWSRVLRVLAGGHAAVARLIADSPFLAALTQPARAGGGRDPEGARSQLSFDLAEVIAAAAARRPVLIVLDDAPPAAAGHHVHTTSNPAARSVTASASRVLPMPGSPVTVSSVPRPARAAASTESTSARTLARAISGTCTPMTTPC